MSATMTINGKTRSVKNLGALRARIRKDRPGSFYIVSNEQTGERATLRAYASATLTIPEDHLSTGRKCRLVVCGSGQGGTWRYETLYASAHVFEELERPWLEKWGVSVTFLLGS